MTEICFDGPESLSAFREALKGKAGSIIGADAKRFMETAETVTCPVEEVVSIIDAPGAD